MASGELSVKSRISELTLKRFSYFSHAAVAFSHAVVIIRKELCDGLALHCPQ
jgi:hypothetical protein